jgi:hypothetical protein
MRIEIVSDHVAYSLTQKLEGTALDGVICRRQGLR